MSPSKPPVLATWLLKHLVTGEHREALLGDILERFAERPSIMWYWRQVFAAVALDLWKEWRIVWIATGATTLWFNAQAVWWRHLWLSPSFDALVAWSMKNPRPLSTIYLIAINVALDVAPLFATLSVCAGVTKRFDLRKFVLGMSAGSFVLEACKMSILGELLIYHVGGAGTPLDKYVIGGLPCFVALLLSLRIVGPRGISRQTARLSA